MTKPQARGLVLAAVFLVAFLLTASAQNPVPFVDQPLVPDAAPPGSSAFTLTVNGAGFVPGSRVTWNRSPLATRFVNSARLTAAVPASDLGSASTASVLVLSPTAGGSATNASFPSFFSIAAVKPGQNTSQVFLPAATYDLGGDYAWSVATADLNKDRIIDLVVTNTDSNSLSVLLGNGDGTFQPEVSYAAGSGGTFGLAIADVNRDGIPDLLVVSGSGGPNGDGMVNVLLGNGDGTFQPAIGYDAGGGATHSIVVGDFNGDGKLDLVVGDRSPTSSCPNCGVLGLLLGNGDGTFQPVSTFNSGGGGVWSIAAADLNADGNLDLVVVNLCPNSTCKPSGGVVDVLLGNGDGTFRLPTTYTSGGDALVPVVADVNGDGRPDILVENSNDSVGVLLGNGDGTFQPAAVYVAGRGKLGSTLAVADINADGYPDVLAAGEVDDGTGEYAGYIGVLFGNGDGTFKSYIEYSSGGVGANGIAIADINGDGLLDAVVANCAPTGLDCDNQYGVVSILLNSGESALPSVTKVSSSLNPSSAGQAVTFTATITSTYGAIPNGELVTFYDGSKEIGTGSTSGGVATFTTSSLTAKTHTIRATYAGDSTFKQSSGTVTQVVDADTTTTTLELSLNPVASISNP